MIDLISRLVVAGGALAVWVHAHRIAALTKYPRRRLAVRWVRHAAAPVFILWSWFALSAPVVDTLRWNAYASRIALMLVLVALWEIASIVGDEER